MRGKWDLEHPERVREINRKSSKKWKLEHPEKVRERNREIYLKNKKRIAEKLKKWKIEHPDKARDQKKSKENRKRLVDSYIRHLFTKTLLKGFKPNEIPKEIIESKKEQIQAFRLYQKIKEELK
jgi:hypothetical protein